MKLTEDEMCEAWIGINSMIDNIVYSAFSCSYVSSNYQDRLDKIRNWRNEMEERYGVLHEKTCNYRSCAMV